MFAFLVSSVLTLRNGGSSTRMVYKRLHISGRSCSISNLIFFFSSAPTSDARQYFPTAAIYKSCCFFYWSVASAPADRLCVLFT